MFERIKKYRHISHVLRNAINTYPGGICFASEDGRPILTNKKMNSLCFEIINHTVTNAVDMWKELERKAIPIHSDTIQLTNSLLCKLNDDSVWQFSRKELLLESGQIYQFDASDITELYYYRIKLQEQNQLVSGLHTRQRDVLNSIVQNNLDKELLRAKMRIHDAFGSLLVMTKNRINEKELEEDNRELLKAWKEVIEDMKNAMVAESKEVSPYKELIKVADLIGCTVKFSGNQPSERKAILLLYAAIREALTNAVKYAGADVITISIIENEANYEVEISSNGKSVNNMIEEQGGLANLRKRMEQEGASLSYRYDDAVTLLLSLPKEYV